LFGSEVHEGEGAEDVGELGLGKAEAPGDEGIYFRAQDLAAVRVGHAVGAVRGAQDKANLPTFTANVTQTFLSGMQWMHSLACFY